MPPIALTQHGFSLIKYAMNLASQDINSKWLIIGTAMRFAHSIGGLTMGQHVQLVVRAMVELQVMCQMETVLDQGHHN